jgi:hypothetical protein
MKQYKPFFIKHWLMKKYCPEYLKKFPKENKDNPYLAGVFKRHLFADSWAYKSKPIWGFQKAYCRARWRGLLCDWLTHGEEHGVEWIVENCRDAYKEEYLLKFK